MESEEDITINKSTMNLTYMPWYEHVKDAVALNWKSFFIFSVVIYGVFWGITESISFFYPDSNLNNNSIILLGVLTSLFVSLFRCIHDYNNFTPLGLENENRKIQKIAHIKKPFWEYALTFALLKRKLQNIDQKIDDVINNRIHIKITKSMDIVEYVHWLATRPENLLGMVRSAKQLLLFDLAYAFNTKNDDTMDLHNLVRVVDLIASLYHNTYEFEVERREIIIPEGFELIHDIQKEWVPPIRDAFKQMLDELNALSLRDMNDLGPIEVTLVFEELPRVDEYCTELERLEATLS